MKKRVIIFAAVCLFLLIPAAVFKTFTINVLQGAVHFPKENVGDALVMEDGCRFTVFRRIKITKARETSSEGSVLKVRFKFKNLGLAFNKRLSMIPALFLAGMKDFQEKYWLVNERTLEFMGLYQWASTRAAEEYLNSFIFKTMCKRSAPGTLTYEVIPNISLFGYIQDHLLGTTRVDVFESRYNRPLKKSFPLSSTRIKAGKSLTVIS